MTTIVRRSHRWLAIVFTLGFLANLAATLLGVQSLWLGLAALLPLLLMMATGLWLFALPLIGRRGT